MERIWGEGGKRKQGDIARYRAICKGLDPIMMWVQCSLWKVREQPTIHMIIEKISHDLFAIPSSRIFSFFLVTFIVSSLSPLLNRPDWTTIFRTAFCFQNMFSTIITESSCISVWITIKKRLTRNTQVQVLRSCHCRLQLQERPDSERARSGLSLGVHHLY